MVKDCLMETCDQSYKGSTIVNCDSRVVTGTTLESQFTTVEPL